jgi:hypothetical protein
MAYGLTEALGLRLGFANTGSTAVERVCEGGPHLEACEGQVEQVLLAEAVRTASGLR